MATDMVRRVEVEGEQGMAVDVGDTWLFVAERGDPGGLPLFVLHGGPGDDHHEFADYLDPLGVGAGGLRLLLVDQRAQGRGPRDTDPATWTLEQMARDVSALAVSLGAQQYAVLGHSYGAMVALQHLVDAPGATVATVVSHGVASSGWFAGLDEALTSFEPVDLRAQVAASWAAEAGGVRPIDARSGAVSFRRPTLSVDRRLSAPLRRHLVWARGTAGNGT